MQIFFYFCTMKMNNIKRKINTYAGLTAIYSGVLLLFFSFLFDWTSSNVPLFLSLFMTIGGVIIHVAAMKSSGSNV